MVHSSVEGGFAAPFALQTDQKLLRIYTRKVPTLGRQLPW